ncbi:hypothetical protein LR48_Vigan10g161200 [Vigna angularis]|uniref:Uncharacterized protein n=1 Tax=Phaseolus angularis TaxID=3914 RepID=A0A0L9VKY9_PHAAN|nr:hypothetical protein LR48_Vigan10g161200 [Vigna angularis]
MAGWLTNVLLFQIDDKCQIRLSHGRPVIDDECQIRLSYRRPVIAECQIWLSYGRPVIAECQIWLSYGRPVIAECQIWLSDGRPVIAECQIWLSYGRPVIAECQIWLSDGRPVIAECQIWLSDGRPVNAECQIWLSYGRPVIAECQIWLSDGRSVNAECQIWLSYGADGPLLRGPAKLRVVLGRTLFFTSLVLRGGRSSASWPGQAESGSRKNTLFHQLGLTGRTVLCFVARPSWEWFSEEHSFSPAWSYGADGPLLSGPAKLRVVLGRTLFFTSLVLRGGRSSASWPGQAESGSRKNTLFHQLGLTGRTVLCKVARPS